MARSQRHKLIEQGTTSAGETIAQGAVAPGLLLQAGEPQTVGVSGELRGVEDIEVPVGEPGGPLSGSTLTGALPTGLVPPEPGPEPEVAPTVSSLDPATAELNSPDFPLHVHGTGFTEASVIYFAGQPEPIEFVSAQEITTIVKPSLPWGPATLPVYVQNGDLISNPLDFTFTEPVAPLAAETETTRSRKAK